MLEEYARSYKPRIDDKLTVRDFIYAGLVIVAVIGFLWLWAFVFN